MNLQPWGGFTPGPIQLRCIWYVSKLLEITALYKSFVLGDTMNRASSPFHPSHAPEFYAGLCEVLLSINDIRDDSMSHHGRSIVPYEPASEGPNVKAERQCKHRSWREPPVLLAQQ